jgi:hypothetical protein
LTPIILKPFLKKPLTMKRIFITASLIASVMIGAQAQDANPTTPATTPILSKRGYAILPETGDWSLSIGASGALRYVGQLFNGGNNNGDTTFGYPNNWSQTVMVRKFTDANTAFRGIVGINLTSATNKTLVNQNGAPQNPDGSFPQVENKRTVSRTNINLGIGLEKRRGIGRVQGIYGAQAIIGLSSAGKTKFEYGNALTATSSGPRTTLQKSGTTFSLAVQAFGGVEYFIAPKISLGGEFSWGPSFSTTGNGKTESESFNNGGVQTSTAETGGSSYIRLDVQNMGGTLRLNFFF